MMRAFSYFSIFIVISFFFLSGCYEPSAEMAKAYNDRLVELQVKAIKLDMEIDRNFHENYYSFHSTEDEEYQEFVEESKERYQKIINEIKLVSDLRGCNAMKMQLLETIQYMSTGLDSYYSELIKLSNNDEKRIEITTQYNEGYNAHEKKFLKAQRELAEKYNFLLVKKE